MIFKNRKDAGEWLAEVLRGYCGADAVIFAIPRGGVLIGAEVARILKLPLSFVIAKKIGHPGGAEYAIAAVSEGGAVVSNDLEVAEVDSIWLRREIESKQRDAEERSNRYRENRKPADLKGKIAIIIDDGIATGFTMRAAIKEIAARKPAKIIVGVPVAPKEAANEIAPLADEIAVVCTTASYFGAVGLYYETFPEVSDKEVIDILKRA